MENKIYRTVSFAVLLLASTSCVAGQGTKVNKTDEAILLRRAVHCLLSDDYVRSSVLSYLGYKLGDVGSAGVREGSVVDPADSTGVYNVLLFSSDGSKSALLMLDASDKRQLKPIPNGYLLRRNKKGWSVEEGEGGYVDYASVAASVTRFKRSVHAVNLEANASECEFNR